MRSLLFVSCLLLAQTKAIDPPSELLICKMHDTDCIAKSIKSALLLLQNGRKDLGIPPIDPIHLANMHIPGSGGQVDLEQTYEPIDVFGLSASSILDGSVDMDNGNCEITMNSLSPHVEIIGQYKFTGKLLLFQINGFGRCNVTLINLSSKHTMKCEHVDVDGEEHLRVTDYKLDMQPESIMYEFENMVDGNRAISDEVLKVMNENNLDIYAEIKKDYDRTFAEIFYHITNKIFNNIPKKKLFLE
ncbi:PREDICTED: protein takeout-like [Nicrophorus vespilloides]|uniref:Protein takeout-like n=1 Tax=Nicrophorus vespilloides TaxID=110193 RepID=A0ABM1NHT0_NICVS|nr:PREDICTED: protein takeout-like [Nicrophorus vespilloides]